MKILNIVGARPNFVKIAPLIQEMRKTSDIHPLLVHTGQHYDPEMSDSFFHDLRIPKPDYHLHVRAVTPASQISEVMNRLEPVILRERPDVVLVVGDVDSTLAGALTAAKLGIAVVHVEAGLRSFDRAMPEETNRILTDAVSELLFASEPSGVENLVREGRSPDKIFLVGNVMIDTLIQALEHPRSSAASPMSSMPAGRHPPPCHAVLTLHRQRLVDNPALFGEIWEALQEIGTRIPIIFPVHPRTQLRLRHLGLALLPSDNRGDCSRGINLIRPLGYMEFLDLQRNAAFVMTDSGGVQEETTALGVPCLTLRENTERPFTVTHGTNTIVGLDPIQIRREAFRILSGETKRRNVSGIWDGRASERIVKVLREYFRSGKKPDCPDASFTHSSYHSNTSVL